MLLSSQAKQQHCRCSAGRVTSFELTFKVTSVQHQVTACFGIDMIATFTFNLPKCSREQSKTRVPMMCQCSGAWRMFLLRKKCLQGLILASAVKNLLTRTANDTLTPL